MPERTPRAHARPEHGLAAGPTPSPGRAQSAHRRAGRTASSRASAATPTTRAAMLRAATRESDEKSQLISILVEELKATERRESQLQRRLNKLEASGPPPMTPQGQRTPMTAADAFVWRERALAAEQLAAELVARVAELEGAAKAGTDGRS